MFQIAAFCNITPTPWHCASVRCCLAAFGRLLMFKECLNHGIVPFIITDELKMYYYRGLHEWNHLPGYLTDTCLTAQDHYKALLDYFEIKY